MNENYFKTISVRISFILKPSCRLTEGPVLCMYYNLKESDVKARKYVNGTLFS